MRMRCECPVGFAHNERLQKFSIFVGESVTNQLYQLCKRAMDHLKAHTGICEDPIYGQGYYAKEEIKPRYEFKRQILRGHAESLGFVVV